MTAKQQTWNVIVQKDKGASVHDYAVRIRRDMGMALDTVFRIGTSLITAQLDFAEQEEGGELKSAKVAYKELLDECRLSETIAARLIRISNTGFLVDCAKKSQLPQGWTVLDKLAALPAPEFKQRMKSGDIHPRLTVKVAGSWINPTTSSEKKKKSITYEGVVTIDAAHDFYVKLGKKNDPECRTELVNVAADAGLDVKKLREDLEELL